MSKEMNKTQLDQFGKNWIGEGFAGRDTEMRRRRRHQAMIHANSRILDLKWNEIRRSAQKFLDIFDEGKWNKDVAIVLSEIDDKTYELMLLTIKYPNHLVAQALGCPYLGSDALGPY